MSFEGRFAAFDQKHLANVMAQDADAQKWDGGIKPGYSHKRSFSRPLRSHQPLQKTKRRKCALSASGKQRVNFRLGIVAFELDCIRPHVSVNDATGA